MLDCARSETALALAQGLADPPTSATFALDSSSVTSAAVLTADASGSVIRLLRLRLSNTDRAVLERIALRVDIDGIRTIELPLSAALVPMSDAAIVDSLPITSSNAEWLLRLPMPFATSARIALEDRGGGTVRGTMEVAVEPRDVTADTYRLFAAYVGLTDVDISVWPGQPTLSTIDGKGRFVGLVYEVGNDDAVPQWWGEGDPILTVDGSTLRGTGTEDHFLFGFCSTERFHSPFSGQTRANAFDNGGFVSLYRFHTSDDVPFTSSFDFEFEMLGWGTYNGHTIRMPTSAVTWFYGRPATVFTGATGSSPTYAPMTLPAGSVRPGVGYITCG